MNSSATPIFDNEVAIPSDLTVNEEHLWLIHMFSAASCHVPKEIWERIRADAERMIEWRRKRGVR